jgi:glycosidase
MLMYEINTLLWINEMSSAYGRPITLGTVPEEELDKIDTLGFDMVWLMGVWTRSPLARRIAWDTPYLHAEYRAALPDYTQSDVVASPYAVLDYTVDPHLGGDDELAALRARLQERGIRLVLDFIPNHLACDHRWLAEHPDYFVQGTDADLHQQPDRFFRSSDNGPVVAYGRPPYHFVWTDTAQLDYRRARTRAAMTALLLDAARHCDGLRCDMAMLVTREIFALSWGGAFEDPAAEFWTAAIAAVRERYPGFCLIAEVYDMDRNMGYVLQQSGFDFTYDKLIYDRIAANDTAGIRTHLGAELSYQQRLVRFIENHDEARALDTMGMERYRPGAVLFATLPGLKLFHHGQLEGARGRLPVQLARRAPARPEPMVGAFYAALLAATRKAIFYRGQWQLCDPLEAWPGNPSHNAIIVYAWMAKAQRRLIAINLADTRSQCYVRLDRLNLAAGAWRFHDEMGPDSYVRTSGDLAAKGLYLDMPGYGYHIFAIEKAG